jgi:hypothetical protein
VDTVQAMKCIEAIGVRAARVVRSRSGYGVIVAISAAVCVAAAILLLIPIVRWIGEPDYITPHRRVERKIDEFV